MSDLHDVLDALSARGRRLRQSLPGDARPLGLANPTDDVPGEVWALFLATFGSDATPGEVRER